MVIEFGRWRLVPVGGGNFELCHRHVATRGKNAGKVQWNRIGRYYQYNTLGNAMLYAATRELGEDGGTGVIEIRDSLQEFERIVDKLLAGAQKCAQELQETHSAALDHDHD